MAQHIPIGKYIKDKKIKKVKEVIEREFTNVTKVRGSLKWRRLPKNYAEFGEEVYTKEVAVPKSMVMGGRAMVEVHFDPKTKKILKKYLVA